MSAAAAPRLATRYFNGRQARAHAVEIHLSDGQLHIDGEELHLQIPIAQVRWAERQRHGMRLTELPDGGQLSHADGQAWDSWARASGLAEPRVVGWMQSWRATAMAGLVCAAVLAATWAWGLPLAARVLVTWIPESVARDLGERVLAQFTERGLAPSELPAEQQAQLRAEFAAAVARTWPDEAPDWELSFCKATRLPMGPNAFALPGGRIVVTDELVQLLRDQPAGLLGVLGHEMGHVRHRHGLRLVTQAGLLGLLSAAVVGDATALLSGGAVVLGQQAYSRQFEREADEAALALLRANQLSPEAMALAFERLDQAQAKRGVPALPIALASHPATAQRIAWFRQAAQPSR